MSAVIHTCINVFHGETNSDKEKEVCRRRFHVTGRWNALGLKKKRRRKRRRRKRTTEGERGGGGREEGRAGGREEGRGVEEGEGEREKKEKRRKLSLSRSVTLPSPLSFSLLLTWIFGWFSLVFKLFDDNYKNIHISMNVNKLCLNQRHFRGALLLSA